MTEPPRSGDQRRRDTLRQLEHEVDCWVATADAAGSLPYLVPLSFLWDGETLLLATPTASPTGRNLARRGAQIRIGLGPTRDVVLIEGSAQALPASELPTELGDSFAAKTGFDPRTLSGYSYFRVRPRRVQAWREANELPGRELMRDGKWVVP